MKKNTEQMYDFNYYNQQYDLKHLNYNEEMVLEILIIARDALWKKITKNTKIDFCIDKIESLKNTLLSKEEKMEGLINKIMMPLESSKDSISSKNTVFTMTKSKYYSNEEYDKFVGFKRLMPIFSKYLDYSQDFYKWEEYNKIIDCFLFNQKLEEKSENFIEILKLFHKGADIFDFNKLDNSHKGNIVNRINDISKYCSLENIVESKDYINDYINNVKNIMNNIKDPLECFNAISLYIKSFTNLTNIKRNSTILLLMIDKIKDNYSLEEQRELNDIMDKSMNNNEIYRVISDNAWQLMRFLTHKEINNIQLLKIIIDNIIDNTKDPRGGMAKIRRNTFFHEKIYKLSLNLEGYDKFTDKEIEIINHNIGELSKSDEKDRNFK